MTATLRPVTGTNPTPVLPNLVLPVDDRARDAITEHRGRKIFRGHAAIRHPDDPFDATSGIGHGRRLLFQDVPEAKTVKNRLHIDIHSEHGGLDELVARLENLGATPVREVNQGLAGHWWIMQDPEGNEFCAT